VRLRSVVLGNLRRRRSRSLFLVGGLLLGIATVVALLSLSRALTVEAQNNLEHFGANIVVVPGETGSSSTYLGVPLGGESTGAGDIREKQLEAIATIPNEKNIAIVAPALLGVVEAERTTLGGASTEPAPTEGTSNAPQNGQGQPDAKGDGRDVLILGVRTEEQFRLKQWWRIDGRRLGGDDEVVVGSVAAERLGVVAGDRLAVGDRDFTVAGILRPTGSQDDEVLLLDLAVAQAILGAPGRVNLIEVAALCSDCPVEDIVAQLRDVLPGAKVTALQQVVRNRMHALDQFRTFSYIAAGVIAAIELLVVFVTVMGSVNARTHEIGIFRALGFRRAHVAGVVMMESAIAAVCAGLLGYLTGMAVSYALLPLLSEGVAVTWTPSIGLIAVVLATAIGAVASVYPALRASRLDPTLAMRTA
jgi:putative ABC transport system permease protein